MTAFTDAAQMSPYPDTVGHMTEQQEGQLQADIPEQEIEFKGRKIWVKMPSGEQLLVWKRTV